MLCWNVYIGDFNKREIIRYNIFDNWSFYDACLKAKKKFKEDKEGFADEVKRWLSYLFRSKCEWEIILDHWPNGEWSELRQKMTVKEMVDMYKAAGKNVETWRISDAVLDKDVNLLCFPDWYRYHDKKIDVYDQVINNWDIFIDYLWDHRKELKVRKI